MKFGTLYAYWTREWHGDYKVFAQKVKDIGFDILEVGAGDLLTMPDAEIDGLRAVSKDLGLTISSNIGPPKDRDVASSDPAVRDAGIRFLTGIMRAMDRLDSRVLVGVTYTYWPGQFDDLDKPAIWARGVESVKKLGKVAQDLGIDLCLEVVNRFETLVLNTCEEGLKFCEEVDNPNVKLLLDTFHMNIEEDDMPAAIRLAGDYLGHLHVGESNRKLPGQGHLPWEEMGRALRDIGFEGGVVMEPFMKMGGKVGEDIKVWRDLSGGADDAAMDAMIRESLVFLKKAFEG
jgi:D-psicose/D-tagatose/L-ribulose 3-epimerase